MNFTERQIAVCQRLTFGIPLSVREAPFQEIRDDNIPSLEISRYRYTAIFCDLNRQKELQLIPKVLTRFQRNER